MVKTALSRYRSFVLNGGLFHPDHPEYRRVLLINTILIGMACISLFFVIVDLAVFNLPILAANNAIGFLFSIFTLIYFHKKSDVPKAAFLTVTVEIYLIAMLIIFIEFSHYGLYWVSFIPVSSYFLLGRKKGFWVTLSIFIALLAFMLTRYSSWLESGFTPESLVNVFMALLCLTILVHYFEIIRQEATLMIQNKNTELEKLSITDKLTGIYNRFKLDEMIEYELMNAERYKRIFSVIIGDIDRFKSINDSFGHFAGDSVLKETSSLIRQTCRKIDTIGRWGGDEFLIICPETSLSGARSLAETIRSSVEKHTFSINQEITISLGVSEYQINDNAVALIKRADDALYSAKDHGRNRVECRILV